MAEFIVGRPLRKLARKHQPLRQLLWRLDFALVWTLHKLLRALPIDLSSRVGNRLGTWVGARMKHKSSIYRENFAVAFPQLSDQELDALVLKAWGRAGRILAEYAHLDTILQESERLEIDIRGTVPVYRDPSIPCVMVSAHVSNWEVICSALARLGIPNASLYSPPTNPLLDRLLMDSRQALNCKLLPRDNSARPLLQALKQGRTIAMVMDRRVEEGKPIRFFGHDKLSTIVPAKLALKFNTQLIPVQTERLQDAHFRVTFHPPIQPSDPQQDDNAQAVDMIQQVHEQFECWIRANPADWFCSKRLWPKGTLDKSEELRAAADVESYAN